MCTNYVTTVRDEIRERLNLNPPTFDYEPELWPGYKGPLLFGNFEWRLAMFGLVPYFSKDGKDFRRTYNARSETVGEKPTYRGPGADVNLPGFRCHAFSSQTTNPEGLCVGGSSAKTELPSP
jgi:putative SOS response-associated peptidase YedK